MQFQFLFIDFLASPPTVPSWSKTFDPFTGNMILTINSNFTFSSVLRMENFTIKVNSSEISPLLFQTSDLSTNFKNISNIHDKLIEVTTTLAITYQWANVPLQSFGMVSSNNYQYTTESNMTSINYKTDIQGIFF